MADTKIRYKGIEHERTEDAPFVGALIIAPTCKFKCNGCFNRNLKKVPDIINTAKEIIDAVKENPFNEGIVLGGLEWSESPLELLELVKEASERGLKIMIYTGCNDLSMFHSRLGEACARKTGRNIKRKNDYDYLIYPQIGSQMLDHYIISDYYIKTGRYDSGQKVEERVHFGVNLATMNQNIYKIERVKE